MYDNYLDCLWIIPAQEKQTIVLTINGIDIEYSGFCTFDYLKVRYLLWLQVAFHLKRPDMNANVLTGTKKASFYWLNF